MSNRGWYFETVDGWTTLYKDKEPYFDRGNRSPNDIPTDDQQAELVGLLNGREDMLAALEWARRRLVDVFAFSVSGAVVKRIDAAIAAAKSGESGTRSEWKINPAAAACTHRWTGITSCSTCEDRIRRLGSHWSRQLLVGLFAITRQCTRRQSDSVRPKRQRPARR